MTLNKNTNTQEVRQQVYDYIMLSLGNHMIDVELDEAHLKLALDKALAKFRQRSPNATEESYCFLTLQQDVNDYVLDPLITNVQSCFRQSFGARSSSNTGSTIEPFSASFYTSYILQASINQGLATFFMFSAYLEGLAKIFGFYINFQWVQQSHTLRIFQRPFADGEILLLQTQNFRPDFNIITDLYAGQWIKDYSLAVAKTILGQARSKFSTIAGPQGGSSLNGAALLQEGFAEIEKLEKEIVDLIPGGNPMTLLIG